MGVGDADCKLQVIYLMILIHLGHLPSEVTNRLGHAFWPMEGTQEENDRDPGLESWKEAMKYKVRRGFQKKKRGFLKTCVQGGDGSGAEDSKHLGSQSACYGHNSKNTQLLFGSRISTLPKAFLVKHCVCVCACVYKLYFWPWTAKEWRERGGSGGGKLLYQISCIILLWD